MAQTSKGYRYPQLADARSNVAPVHDHWRRLAEDSDAKVPQSMTTAQINALTGVDLWPGRVVLNGDLDELVRWHPTKGWGSAIRTATSRVMARRLFR